MAPGRPTRSFVYLASVTGICGGLAVVGYVLDRLPLLPPSVTSRYQRFMFATIFGLSRFVDGWTDQPAEPVAGGLPGESAP